MNIINLNKKIRSSVHCVLLVLFWLVVRVWLKFQSKVKPDPTCMLVISCDTTYVVGSKGDEAMLMAALDKMSESFAKSQTILATSSVYAAAVAARLGMKTMNVWGGIFMPFRFLKSIDHARPAIGLLIGADVMDGYYSPVVSLRMIIAADLLARYGTKVAFLGFSMNSQPSGILKYAFRMLHPKVSVNLRDALSYQRYVDFTGMPARLVADSAFMLKPERLSGDAIAAQCWISSQKEIGRMVLAINFHPMLFPAGDKGVSGLAEALKKVLAELSQKYGISWLLLPHDDRPEAGDITTLPEFYQSLSPEVRQFTHIVRQAPSAAQIKALVADLDGVVTGRMHLAIATFGQAKPVMVFAYQGKFAGLFNHFDLPEWLILDPLDASNTSYLMDRMDRFVQELPDLTAQISGHLPRVLAASEATLKDVL